MYKTLKEKPCPSFKKYKGIRKPKCSCKPCWKKYIKNQPDKVTQEIDRLVDALLAAKDELRAFQRLCKHPKTEALTTGPIYQYREDGSRYSTHDRQVRQCKICKYRFVAEKKPRKKQCRARKS